MSRWSRAAERAGALLRLFDADGDGCLSFDEFRGENASMLVLKEVSSPLYHAHADMIAKRGAQASVRATRGGEQRDLHAAATLRICPLPSGAGRFSFPHEFLVNQGPVNLQLTVYWCTTWCTPEARNGCCRR